jgi:hypothetical protein
MGYAGRGLMARPAQIQAIRRIDHLAPGACAHAALAAKHAGVPAGAVGR